MRSSKKQVLNSDKNTKIKHIDDDIMFVGCEDGYLFEYSIIEKKHVHQYGCMFNGNCYPLAKTIDNKSQFMPDYYTGGFVELDISTRKQVSRFPSKGRTIFVVTPDNKSLITVEWKYEGGSSWSSTQICILTKWSIRGKKHLHTWQSNINKSIISQSVSYDNKYQLIGYIEGWLEIFDLQKNQTLQSIQLLEASISSVAFSRDNQRAFISDDEGNIKVIKWTPNANSGDDFNFTEEPRKVGNQTTDSICLTKDEKYLLVGSDKQISVFETTTREITKEFKLSNQVVSINLIKDDKRAIIADENGNLSNLDLETLEIEEIAHNITMDQGDLVSLTII